VLTPDGGMRHGGPLLMSTETIVVRGARVHNLKTLILKSAQFDDSRHRSVRLRKGPTRLPSARFMRRPARSDLSEPDTPVTTVIELCGIFKINVLEVMNPRPANNNGFRGHQ